jgi:mRNA interferase RelE/StbE
VYEVILERSAENDLKRLPTSVFHRIIAQIKPLAENPRPSGCRKITGSKNDWRIRIGDYRVIYEIDEKANLRVRLALLQLSFQDRKAM